MTSATRSFMVGLLILATAGCSTSSDATRPGTETTEEVEPRPLDTDALQDTVWSLQFGGGPDGDVVLVDGWPITMAFSDDVLGGRAACNSYSAKYLIDGSQLTLEKLTNTDAGCELEITQAEQAFLVALRDVDGINLIDDDLALSGPASELLFRPISE